MSTNTNPQTDHQPIELAQATRTLTPRPLYVVLASLLEARLNCQRYPGWSNDHEWFERHTERIMVLVAYHMPSGSGFNSGTTLDIDRSTPEKLIFTTGFHHMSESGMYDGWTDHEVIITPSLAVGFVMRITGRDRDGIKEKIRDIFSMNLETPV
jgi:hypothetical protein